LNYEKAEKEIHEILSTKTRKDTLQQVVDFLYGNFEHYSWIGIYIVRGDYLILGPWKGEQATEHIKIPIGRGICGSAAKTGKTEIIDNVNTDNRYLSCFISTKSEIVVPIKKQDIIVGEIDIDSDKIAAFTNEDKLFLEKVANLLKDLIRG
jgi:GAF domain-containing protein